MNKDKIEQAIYHIKGITEYIEDILNNVPFSTHLEELSIKELLLRNKDISSDVNYIISNLIFFINIFHSS